MILQGYNAIVTGGSEGLGAHIAKELIREGASVLICARGQGALDATAARLKDYAGKHQSIIAARCDITQELDIDRVVTHALEHFGHVDILVNNAGVYGPMGLLEDVDWCDWKDAVITNLFGAMYFCRTVIPHFKERQFGKIINLSGGGATSPLPRISAYAASKAAIVRMTETLAEEVKGHGIDVNAIAPGVLDTRLTEQLLNAGPDVVGQGLFERVSKLAQGGHEAASKSAKLCAYLASRESDGITGRLISAVWDPWPELERHKSSIMATDIYTLRRILPKDRGEVWGE